VPGVSRVLVEDHAVVLVEMPDGRVRINELSLRPHNTGHYSIKGTHTSQFENHVRAIPDWPPGDSSLRMPAAVTGEGAGSTRRQSAQRL
jgi:phosphoribosylaminoimidazole carboxylase (NCAIR synthetase)